jgi:hypothetical protein
LYTVKKTFEVKKIEYSTRFKPTQLRDHSTASAEGQLTPWIPWGWSFQPANRLQAGRTSAAVRPRSSKIETYVCWGVDKIE